MHVLGARHPGRIAGLVYIDAAFNRGDGSEAYDAVARTLPPSPRPGPADMASFTALRSFLEKTVGAVGPEAHLRARWVANADGTVARPWAPAPPVFQAISSDLMRPWYNADDPVVRERAETLYRLARERFARHATWFEALAGQGRISELSGAHHLFISSPPDVLEQINAFASSLP